jgi:hypothetical protein
MELAHYISITLTQEFSWQPFVSYSSLRCVALQGLRSVAARKAVIHAQQQIGMGTQSIRCANHHCHHLQAIAVEQPASRPNHGHSQGVVEPLLLKSQLHDR